MSNLKALYDSPDKKELFDLLVNLLKDDEKIKKYQTEAREVFDYLKTDMAVYHLEGYQQLFSLISRTIRHYASIYVLFRDEPRISAVLLYLQAKSINTFRLIRQDCCACLRLSKESFNRYVPNNYDSFKQSLSRNAEALFFHLKPSPRYSKLANTVVGHMMYSMFKPRKKHDLDANTHTPLSNEETMELFIERLYGTFDIQTAPMNDNDVLALLPGYEESVYDVYEDDDNNFQLPNYDESQRMLARMSEVSM